MSAYFIRYFSMRRKLRPIDRRETWMELSLIIIRIGSILVFFEGAPNCFLFIQLWPKSALYDSNIFFFRSIDINNCYVYWKISRVLNCSKFHLYFYCSWNMLKKTVFVLLAVLLALHQVRKKLIKMRFTIAPRSGK